MTRFLGTFAIVFCLCAGPAVASISLANQNFDGIGPGGASMPMGWTVGYFNPAKNRDGTAGTGTAYTFAALLVDDGSGTGGSNGYSYNYGTAFAADRAVGAIPRTGQGDRLIQVAVTNTANYAMTSIDLSYWGEQWHRGESKAASQPEKLRVYFSPNSSISNFVRMSGFDFVAPQNISGASQAALDGNAAANRTLVSGNYIPAAPIAPGATFYIRWYDYNDDQTLDHGLAIDDVSIIGVPEPAALSLLAIGALALLRRR